MEEERARVAALIDKFVHSTEAEVNPSLLKAIKLTVRYSDSELRCAAQTLMSLMKRKHSQVRYRALLIIDELFMRSKLFRSVLIENLDQLLSLSIGFRGNDPLPAPVSVATALRSRAFEFLEKWNESFGIHYRQIRLGYDYLKNTLRLQFPNMQVHAARREQERRAREMKTKEILLEKFESFKAKFSSIKEEIQINIDEINECLEILATEDDDIPLDLLDDEEMEEFRNSELRQLRLEALAEGGKVHENNENTVVFDALREFYKVLITKHLAAVQEWISVLIRVETPDTSFRDSALKNLIDMRNLIQSTKIKCEKSGCELSKTANTADEEDIWEDGTSETFDKGKSGPSCSSITEAHIGSTSKISRHAELSKTSSSENEKKKKKNNRSSGSKSNPSRGKLMGEAPVLNWGSYLDNWGLNRDVLANQRGLELDGHWGRVDYDAVIPAEKIAELNVHASVYKPEPVETLPCKAPLKKGGLCPRRDLRVCPFHGPIIPRDGKGNPVTESSTKEKSAAENQTKESTPGVDDKVVNQLIRQAATPGMDDKLVNQLLRQAAKNVRERDKEAAKQRELNEKALKKARLAKIREHNQSVLRDAAIASTSKSYYVGEETGTSSRSAKSKRQTLASMLKKKESSKQRLAQRLMNSRLRNATIRQMTGAEDANYREAFPNQW